MKNMFDSSKNGHGCLMGGQMNKSQAVCQGTVAALSASLWHRLRLQKVITAMLALLAAGSLLTSARAQDVDDVYAVEFNQANNRFGTLDLLTGNFTQISALGGTIYNDVAYNPLDGTVYGIANNCGDLVTFNPTNGAVSEVAPFNVSGIESLAFQPGTGVLYGCAQNGLYTINLSNGQATFVGSFGTPYNLNLAQNIRFDSNGNLYLSNTSDNTDFYQVNIENGSATFVGEATGYADLVLMNAGQYMYAVSIPAINGASAQPELLSLDVNSFVDGGTNADGSIHQISVTLVGGGPAFPINFDFSGDVPAVIPPPWVPTMTIAPQTDGSVKVTASGGNSGQTYVFEYSSDMFNWNVICTNSADANGAATIIDACAKNFPGRFYRTVTPQQ